jgi:predicted outer membrane repeat protein
MTSRSLAFALLALVACGDKDDSAVNEDSQPSGDSAGDTQTGDTGEPQVDFDQDGWPRGEDCDDNDASINPDATELPCNGVDEDCSGRDGDQEVPGDHPSIQGALAAAAPGDWVCVGEGTWEHFIINQSVNLVSTGGPEATIIDGEGSALLGSIDGASEVLVRGFTFRNGLSNGQVAGLSIIDSSEVTVSDCVFDSLDGADNIAGLRSDGGGALSVEGCTFNACTGSGGAALAFYHGGDATVIDSTFEGNEAPYGAALVASGMESLEVLGGSFEGNIATVGGGAIAVGNTDSVSLSGLSLVGNSAGSEGGHLWLQDLGSVQIEGTELSAGASGGDGGGILATGVSELVIDGSVFDGNSAVGGAAVYAASDGRGLLWILDTAFTGHSNDGGPGIIATDTIAELVLASVDISGSTSEQGAVVSATATGAVELSDCSFVDNLAPSTSSTVYGALHVDGAETVLVQSTWFENNHSGLVGGGVTVMGSRTVIVDDSVVTGNTAAYGGGGYFSSITDLAITGSEISSNVASVEGGGLKIESSDLVITDTDLQDNTPDNMLCVGSTGCVDS